MIEVLQVLKASPCVEPFDVHNKPDVEDADVIVVCTSDVEPEQDKPKPRKKKNKCPKKKSPKAKAKGDKQIDAQTMGQALADADAKTRSEVEKLGELKYSPKRFASAKNTFVSTLRSSLGISMKVANEKWMLCNLRSDFLQSLPESELKKRRFM